MLSTQTNRRTPMMRTAIARKPLLLMAVLFASACGGAGDETQDPTQDPQGDEELRSTLSRNTSPSAPTDEVKQVAGGNNAFALALYGQMKSASDDSFFFSPFSISQALAMTYAGALGTTESQMKSTLHYPLAQAALHPAFNALDLALASRGKGAKGKDGKGFRLNLSNALWVQQKYNVLTTYLDTLALNYGAGMRPLNFMDYPEPSRKTINAYVANQTEQKITELLPQGIITSGTRLVLTNTIYFNAAWADVFPTSLTSKAAFHRLDGTTATLATMTNVKTFPYVKGAGFEAVELPYDGKELSMLVIVPDSGQFKTVEGAILKSGVDSIVSSLASTTLELTLPKWKLRSKLSAKAPLKALGMVEAFDAEKANFAGINGGTETLFIGDVIHEATVDVDEYGTEASAATAVVMVGSGMSQQMTVDRPFIFAIRDVATRSILFLGRLTNPTP
jgi:serpin B